MKKKKLLKKQEFNKFLKLLKLKQTQKEELISIKSK
jgi:hypothetical protein